MSKKNILWILIDLIFLIVFNVVFFSRGGRSHPASVWISYGFIHFAYAMLLITPLLIRKSSSMELFGTSLYSISFVYFAVVLITGLIFIIAKPESYKGSLITQVIISGLFALVLCADMIANDRTADSVELHEIELHYVNECSARLKAIMESIDDKKLRKNVEKAYDLLHSSQVKSSSLVRECEIEVSSLIKTLEANISHRDIASANATIDQIIKVANERNRRLKYGLS